MCTDSIQFLARIAISLNFNYNTLQMNSLLNESTSLIELFIQFQIVNLSSSLLFKISTTNKHMI